MIVPIAHTKLYANQLTTIDQIESDTNNLLHLIINEKSISFNLDSITNLPDTIILFRADSITVINWGFPTGSTIPVLNNKQFEFDLNSINLKKVILSTGLIELNIKSTLDKKTEINFLIPSATKDGIAINITKEIPASSNASPSSETILIDLANYEIDLTINNTTYNTITTSVIATVTELNDTLYTDISDYVDISISFKDITPRYSKGGFDNYIIHGKEFVDIKSPFNFNIDGQLYFDDYYINSTLKNFLGIDIQTSLNQVYSSNNGILTPLVSELINKNINITRALEQNLFETPAPSIYNFEFTPENSNVNDLFESTPDGISFDYSININPLGNNSLDNDFIYTDKNIELDLEISSPLHLAMNNFSISDTIVFDLDQDTLLKNTESLQFNLISENSFPFTITPIVYLLDSNLNTLDSIFYDDQTIEKGYTDENNLIIAPFKTIINTNATTAILILPNIKYVIIKATFNTENYSTSYPIYSYNNISLKLTAEFEQLINFN